jgi:integrase
MAARIKKDDDGVWCSTGSAYGERLRRRFPGRTKQQAQEELDLLVERARKRKLYGEKDKKTFDEAARAYLLDGGSERGMEKALIHFGLKPVDEITPGDVRQFAREMYPGTSGATKNTMAITPVRAVVNWAHQQGWCGAMKVKGFETDPVTRKAVSPEWLRRFAAAAEETEDKRRRLGAMAMTMATTGTRIGECVSRTWGHMDWEAGELALGRTKNGEVYVVRLPQFLVDWLREMKGEEGEDDPIFGFENKAQVYYHWRRVTEAAGVEYVPPHQAGRHTFATELHNTYGWSANDIATAGRWKSVALVQDVYIHSDKGSEQSSALFDERWGKTALPFRPRLVHDAAGDRG